VPREFRYAVGLDRTGRISADGGDPVDVGAGWKPEHLVLAGLVRCTLASLRFHAEPAGVDFLAAASARGIVTQRRTDGRFAFSEIDVDLDLELDPAPPGDELVALLAKAERDCFVGASLEPGPRYRWRVNGADMS
jgi:uncharacterized OsmC-like protein